MKKYRQPPMTLADDTAAFSPLFVVDLSPTPFARSGPILWPSSWKPKAPSPTTSATTASSTSSGVSPATEMRRTMDKEEKEKGRRSKKNRSDLGRRAPGRFLPSSASSPTADNAGRILSPLRCRCVSDGPRKIRPSSWKPGTLVDHLSNDHLIDLVECKIGDRDEKDNGQGGEGPEIEGDPFDRRVHANFPQEPLPNR